MSKSVWILLAMIGGLLALAVRWSVTPDYDAPARWEPTPRSPAWQGGPVKPREDWFYYQRAYPLDRIPAAARIKALGEAASIPEARRRFHKATAASPWTEVGPRGFDSDIEPTWGRMSGRVRALAIDPNNSNRLFLGTASGGVWRSTNGGTTWVPLTDNQPSLAVGAIAIDPQNSNTIYVGTGEGNGTYYGVGLLKSIDGGNSWTQLAEAQLGRGAIAGLLVSPFNSNLVVACATFGTLLLADEFPDPGDQVGGVYRSTDGGVSFTLTDSSFCRGIAAVPDDFNIMYYSATGLGADNGLYRSTDAGQSWAPVTGAISGVDLGRLAIGLSSDGSQIYIGGSDGDDVVIQTSSDGGANWGAVRRTPKSGAEDAGQYCEFQCDYDNVIAVNPFDSDQAFFGGVGLYRTNDGAATFSLVGNNNAGGGPLHVDHHVFVYDPGINGTAYNGNDGGIYKTSDNGSAWTPLSGTLSTLQPYQVSLHPTDPNILFTGNQDNGTTRRTTGDTWTEISGGDGGFTAIDFANPQTVYVSTTELNFNRSNNAGNAGSFFDATPPLDNSDRPNFIAPVVMDPGNSSVLYAGSNRVFRTDNGAANWTAVSGDLTGGNGNITNLAVSSSDSGVVYAVTSNGRVQRASVNGSNFSNVTSAPLPGRYATSVAVHPTNADIAYVTYSGFDENTPGSPGHVFKTDDGGANWTDVTANLPNIPYTAVEVRPDDGDEVYVGSDIGVFISLNAGGSWEKMSNGLPNAGVADLAVNLATDLLAVATYGRSVWVTSLTGGAGGGNRVPTPQNDSATVVRGGTVDRLDSGQSSLLGNDTDPDSDDLTAQTTAVTAPANGDLILAANGTFSYTHDDGMTDSDSFVYRACDDAMPSLCGDATVTITVTEPGGGMVCSSPGAAIPDEDPTGVSDTLTVTDAGTLSDLDVSVVITHTFVGDISVTLTHVNTATVVALISEPENGNCDVEDIDVTLDDDAGQSADGLCDDSPPALGGIRSPTEALAGFNGENLAGDWTLMVTDSFAPDDGTLDSWCLLPTTVPLPAEIFADGFETASGRRERDASSMRRGQD